MWTFLCGLLGGTSGVIVLSREGGVLLVDFLIAGGVDGFLTDCSESLFLLSEPKRKKDLRLFLLLLKLSNIGIFLC